MSGAGGSTVERTARLVRTKTEAACTRGSRLVRTVTEDSIALEASRQAEAEVLQLHASTEESVKVAYRSTGLGIYAVVMRFAGMPLERLAMVLNSSQVSGQGQLSQAANIVFADGAMAPFRTVGRASLVAWFLQYSVMGCVFQVCDRALSRLLGVRCIPYGEELMRRPDESAAPMSASEQARAAGKVVLAPLLSGCIESSVSNRAEAQRFYGIDKLAAVEAKLGANPVARALGPGFAANASRNFIMAASSMVTPASSSFVVTPVLYQRLYPQEKKDAQSLFWFGLGVNIFAGNAIAITQQALWGRALDYAAAGGGRPISYAAVVREGLAAEGSAAFITPTKWVARVLMNAPVQGTLPWFYNEVLPLGEGRVLGAARQISAAFGGGPRAA